MEFTIYSIGSAAYLEEILNSVAMISGSGKIEDLAKIGLLIGVFILGFQAVFNNTGIHFQKVGVCLILYLAAFGPQVTVLIQDVYTGEVAVVDNVPLGPVAVGSIVSNLGYDITSTFEQAFSTPGMTSYGFVDPLETLQKFRSISMNTMSIPSFVEDGGNQNLVASWTNYMKECTFTGYGADARAIQNMMRDSDPLRGLKFESSVYYTLIYDGSSPQGRTLTCSAAHSELMGMTQPKADGIIEDVGRIGFKKLGKQAPDYASMEARLNNSLYGLGLIATNARTFALASSLLPVLQRAPGEKAIEELQAAAAIMMNDSMMKTNTQWAAEGSKFTQYVRPFMTFFEGFIYAITPLMAFVMVLGGFGIGLISKYLLILVWMMLWMPILSIINLYILSYGADKISAVVEASLSSGDVGQGISFQGLIAMQPVIESLIGTAGLMASSVPALSLFLVYGTSVAASGIASRLSGGDTINESFVAPDPMKVGAALDVSSIATNDPIKGTILAGSDATRGNISFGKTLSDSIQSTRATAEQSSQQFSEQLSSAFGNAYQNSSSISDAARVGQSLSSTFGLSNSASYQTGINAMKKAGFGSDLIDATVASIASSTGISGRATAGGGSGPSASLDASAKGSMTSQQHRNDKRTLNDALDFAKSVGLDQSVKNGLDSAKGYDIAKNFQSGETAVLSETDTKTLSQTASKTLSDQESYQRAQSLQDQFGYDGKYNIDTFAGMMMKRGQSAALVDAARNEYGERNAQNYAIFDSILDPARRETAAAIQTLAENGRFDLLGGADINPNENSNLRGANVQGVESRAASAGSMASGHGVHGRVDAERDSAIEGLNLKDRYEQKNKIVENDAQVYARDTATPQVEQAENRLRGLGNGSYTYGETSYGAVSAIWNKATSGLHDRETYHQEGLSYNLNDAQAEVFAAARMGEVWSSETRDKWNAYAESQNMDPELRDGMFKALTQAGLHDDGSGGQLTDIRMVNVGSSTNDVMVIRHNN
ncbi:conjugal transfer protein TraG N-terminal domain-containing protein [Metapseudomonas otitidis]|uniref:conjugal transfer protein TraG N-terminal domain-containing protein n=1 Tax=Metapseudomonas otitidis TaxID=319939 RepID=UPI0013F5E5AB|nr:conjugal transfer protein TraG N-terminal domain-containing protein [Pseudomonas otitidis]